MEAGREGIIISSARSAVVAKDYTSFRTCCCDCGIGCTVPMACHVLSFVATIVVDSFISGCFLCVIGSTGVVPDQVRRLLNDRSPDRSKNEFGGVDLRHRF